MTRVIGNFELFIGREALEKLVVRMKALSYESGLLLVDRNVSSHFRVSEILDTLRLVFMKFHFQVSRLMMTLIESSNLFLATISIS